MSKVKKVVLLDENWKDIEGNYICPLCYKRYSKYGMSRHIKVTHFGMKHSTTGLRGWNKGLTKETDHRIKKIGETLKSRFKKGELIPKGFCSKEYLGSEKHRKASSKGGGYRENSGRSNGDYREDSFGKKVYLQSSYELKCADILDQLKIDWIRPNYLNYNLNGKDKKYYPDFLLVDYNLYLDPKNSYLQKLDKEKIDSVMNQNKVQVVMLSEKEISKKHLLYLIEEI